MIDSDIPQFRKAMRVYFQTVHATGNVSIDVIANYWKALQPFPLDKVLHVIETCSLTETNHVPPARMAEMLSGKKTEKCRDAFHELVALLQMHGVEGAINRVDKETKAYRVLKACGGFRTLNNDVNRVKSDFQANWERIK